MKSLWKNFDKRMGHKRVEFLFKLWPWNKSKNKPNTTDNLKEARQSDAEFAKWFVRENKHLKQDQLLAKLKQELKTRQQQTQGD